MNHISYKNLDVFLPMPVFPVIEDVGWWQGQDGSASQQPYRNAFSRRHCLADYQALVRLADRLGVRIGLGMVLCEWDRNNLLGGIRALPGWVVTGTTKKIRGRGLMKLQNICAASKIPWNWDYMRFVMNSGTRERWSVPNFMTGMVICDQEQVIKSHFEAFGMILEQNGFSEFPRLFFPPALNHSFGNGKESIQAILYDYGIRYVVTRFSRARRFAPPHHEKITWECGVGLLERGLSPVPWNMSASPPGWDFSGPILPLHWGNLLHPDQNVTVIS